MIHHLGVGSADAEFNQNCTREVDLHRIVLHLDAFPKFIAEYGEHGGAAFGGGAKYLAKRRGVV
ncbi:MAG: hypothetical protein VYE18_08585, partial [Pseudomonadota bacterium]|nr:hypothetical protein [Pseudomonadota bacterium]